MRQHLSVMFAKVCYVAIVLSLAGQGMRQTGWKFLLIYLAAWTSSHQQTQYWLLKSPCHCLLPGLFNNCLVPVKQLRKNSYESSKNPNKTKHINTVYIFVRIYCMYHYIWRVNHLTVIWNAIILLHLQQHCMWDIKPLKYVHGAISV